MALFTDPTALDFSEGSLFLSLAISSVGAVLFFYGRKQRRWPQLAAGVLLSVFPYFVSGIGVTLTIAVAIVAGMWLALRQGW